MQLGLKTTMFNVLVFLPLLKFYSSPFSTSSFAEDQLQRGKKIKPFFFSILFFHVKLIMRLSTNDNVGIVLSCPPPQRQLFKD